MVFKGSIAIVLLRLLSCDMFSICRALPDLRTVSLDILRWVIPPHATSPCTAFPDGEVPTCYCPVTIDITLLAEDLWFSLTLFF